MSLVGANLGPIGATGADSSREPIGTALLLRNPQENAVRFSLSVSSRPRKGFAEGGGWVADGWRMGGRPPSPKGLRPPAQGRPNGMRPTLGMGGVTIEPQSGSGRDGWENGVWGATPLGLRRFVGRGPGVAVWRPQPRAGGRERRRRRDAAGLKRRKANRDSYRETRRKTR